MKILAAGDIHGDTRLANELAEKAEKEKVDLVVLCGDLTYNDTETKGIIGPFIKKNQRVVLIPGNHETIATADFLAEMARTKRIEGTHLGEKNPMYGKKRLDLSNRNKEQWANIEYRKKIKSILSKTIYKGSKRQKNLYNYLLNHFRNKIIYNDWKSLDYKYELDISIPSKKIAVEWDGYRWHYQNKDVEKKDLIKNNEILNKGWKFIRIKDNHLNKSQINEINKQVVYLINNIHTPEFKYTGGIYIE